MDDRLNMQGKWTGVIVFGKEYPEHIGEKLYFEAEIFQDGNMIRGTAIDSAGVGVSPDPTSISGTCSNNRISFIKQYSSMHFFNNGEVIVDKTKRGFKIHYTGEFDDNDMSFKGNWIIKSWAWILGIIPIRYINTGTWTMQRK